MATLADKLLKYASEIKKRNLENSRFVSFSERTLIYELDAGSQASTHVLYFSPPTLCLKLIFNVALRSTDCEMGIPDHKAHLFTGAQEAVHLAQ